MLARAGTLLVLTRAAPLFAADLRWSGPPDCARQDAVSRQVESIVGRPLASVDALDFEVTVTRDGDAWRLELVTEEHGAKGRRSLAGQSCAEVTDAAAVLIAMAIRSAGQAPVPTEDRPAASDDVASAPAAVPAGKAAPSPSAPPPEPPPRPKARPLGPVFGLSGVLDTAALPAASPGIGAHAGITGSSLRLEVEGAAFLATRLALEQGRSAEFDLVSGALVGCVERSFGTLRAGGCAGFELGRLSGEGQGVSDPHLGSALWEAGRLELGGWYPLGHELWLTARVGMAIPVSRPEFELEGKPVYRPAALGLRASLGVELLP